MLYSEGARQGELGAVSKGEGSKEEGLRWLELGAGFKKSDDHPSSPMIRREQFHLVVCEAERAPCQASSFWSLYGGLRDSARLM